MSSLVSGQPAPAAARHKKEVKFTITLETPITRAE
jgi:hypothetical protein